MQYYNEEGSIKPKREVSPLKTHRCSDAEISLGSNNSRDVDARRFFKLRDDYVNDAKNLLGN